MCKSLAWRAWMVGLILLFGAGIASGQMAPLPFQNTIAWGGPIQPPDVSKDHPQPIIAPDVAAETPDETSAGTPGQTSGDTVGDNPKSSNANSPDSITASATLDNTVRQLGTPFPLDLQPQGLKIGPFYLVNVSDSFFYAVSNTPGQPTQTFAGNSLGANLVSSKQFSDGGILAVQARGQFSLSGGQPFFNTALGATFNDQLSERWSLTASAQFTYFQNSILANPQYLLSYQNAGIVQQTLYVLQPSYNIYESNNISLTYQLGGRTQIAFTPILGATFQYLQGGWSSLHQFGGGVSVTHTLTSDLSVSAFYSLSYAATSGAAATTPGWVNQNLGVSLQGTFVRYRGWSLGGSLSASSQTYAGSYTLTPTGNLRLMKSFRQSSISAAYTRTEASYVLVSSGYFDQARHWIQPETRSKNEP